MSFRTILLIIGLAVTLVTFPGSKFDAARQIDLLLIWGILPAVLLILSWKKIKSVHRGALFAMCGFWLAMLISWRLSDVKNYGWSEIVMLYAAIVTWFVAQSFDEKEKKFTLVGIYGFAVLSTLYGMYWYITHDEPRMAGTFLEYDMKAHFWPNAYAVFLLMVWPIGLLLRGKMETSRGRGILLLGNAILLAGIMLTYSRGAWLVFAVQCIALAIVQRKNHASSDAQFRWKYLTITVAIMFTFILGLQELRGVYQSNILSFSQKATFQGTEKETSLHERWEFFTNTPQLILQKPFFGHGPYSFRFTYPQVQTTFLATSDHPHNWFLKVAVEEGIVGLMLLIFGLGALVYTNRHAMWTEEKIFFTIALGGATLHSMIDYNFNFISNIIIFWLLLGFWSEPEKSSSRLQKLIITTLVCAVTFSVLHEAFVTVQYKEKMIPEEYASAVYPRQFWFDRSVGASAEYDIESALQYIAEQIKRNPLDAYAWSFQGDLQKYRGDYESALESYKQAVIHDPANMFAFYTNLIETSDAIGKSRDTIQTYINQGRAFLLKYPDQYAKNLHYTRSSPNPKFAQKFAELIGEKGIAEALQPWN